MGSKNNAQCLTIWQHMTQARCGRRPNDPDPLLYGEFESRTDGIETHGNSTQTFRLVRANNKAQEVMVFRNLSLRTIHYLLLFDEHRFGIRHCKIWSNLVLAAFLGFGEQGNSDDSKGCQGVFFHGKKGNRVGSRKRRQFSNRGRACHVSALLVVVVIRIQYYTVLAIDFDPSPRIYFVGRTQGGSCHVRQVHQSFFSKRIGNRHAAAAAASTIIR